MSFYRKLFLSLGIFAFTGTFTIAHPHNKDQLKEPEKKQEISKPTENTESNTSDSNETNTGGSQTDNSKIISEEVAPLDPIYLTGAVKDDIITNKPNSTKNAENQESKNKTAQHTTTQEKSGKLLDVLEVKSEKGLTAWLVQHPGLDVISVDIAFRHAGSKTDPKGKKGLADFVAAMLDEGAGDMKSEDFARYLLKQNIQLGIKSSKDEFTLTFRCTRENLAEAFDIFKLMLTEARFDDEAFARVKNRRQTILSQKLQSDRTIAIDKMAATVYPNKHPYRVKTTDKLADLDNITQKDLRDFTKQHFGQDNLVIGVAGDITSEELKSYLDKTFTSLPRKAVPFEATEVKLQNLGSVNIQSLESPQSRIIFLHEGIKRSDPEFFAAYLLNHAFGGSVQNCRLWEEIREKRGLAYIISTYLVYSNHSQMLIGVTATDNAKAAETIKVLKQQWKKVAEEGISNDELANAKKQIIGSYPLVLSSTGKISGTLVGLQLEGLDKEYPNTRRTKINAVTIQDIRKVAKRLIKPENLTFIIVGQPDSITETKSIAKNKPTTETKSRTKTKSAIETRSAIGGGSGKDGLESSYNKASNSKQADSSSTSSGAVKKVAEKSSSHAKDVYNKLMDNPKDLSSASSIQGGVESQNTSTSKRHTSSKRSPSIEKKVTGL